MKRGMDQGYFLLKDLRKVQGEFSLTALAYYLKRVLNIVGVPQVVAALAQAGSHRRCASVRSPRGSRDAACTPCPPTSPSPRQLVPAPRGYRAIPSRALGVFTRPLHWLGSTRLPGEEAVSEREEPAVAEQTLYKVLEPTECRDLKMAKCVLEFQ